MISVNKKSQELVKDLIDNSDYYRVSVSKGHNDCVIIDAGVNELGNMEAGRACGRWHNFGTSGIFRFQ